MKFYSKSISNSNTEYLCGLDGLRIIRHIEQKYAVQITFESEETDTNFALAIWSYLTDECKVRWASIDQDLNHEIDNDRVAFRLENMKRALKFKFKRLNANTESENNKDQYLLMSYGKYVFIAFNKENKSLICLAEKIDDKNVDGSKTARTLKRNIKHINALNDWEKAYFVDRYINISKSTKDRKNPKYENYVWYFEHLNSDKSKKSCLKENEVYRIDINGNPMMYELVRKLEQKFEEYKVY